MSAEIEGINNGQRTPEEQLAWELQHLSLTWAQRSARWLELARQATLEGNDILAQNYTLLSQLSGSDSLQAARESGQATRGDQLDRVIPTFTLLPGEDTQK